MDALEYLHLRKQELEAAKVAATEHLNCIRGGLAEIEYAIQNIFQLSITPAIESEQGQMLCQETGSPAEGVGA